MTLLPSPPRPGVRDDQTHGSNAIFQQPWWLDAVAPGQWGEVTCEEGGRVVARLPYVVRGRPRFRVLTQSSLTQTLGPWIEATDAKPVRAFAREQEILTELEARLPPAQAFQQQFSPLMLNALPFHWAGYRLEVGYTYRIEGLASTDTIWDRLRDNIRREVRKARKRVEVVENLGVDRFYDVLSQTYARQGIPTPHTLAELERLEAACARHDAGTMLFARDEADRIHAVAWIGLGPFRRVLPAGRGGADPAHKRGRQPARLGGDRAGGGRHRRLRLPRVDAPARRALRAGVRQPADAVPARDADESGGAPGARGPLGLAARRHPHSMRYLRRIFPRGLLGISSRNSTIWGTLKLARRSRQNAMTSRWSQPSSGTIAALTISSPALRPGTPTTTASRTLRMGGEDVLDLDGVDLVAGDLDEELLAAGDEDTTVGVDAAEIAREVAAVAEGLAGELLRCRRSLARSPAR